MLVTQDIRYTFIKAAEGTILTIGEFLYKYIYPFTQTQYTIMIIKSPQNDFFYVPKRL